MRYAFILAAFAAIATSSRAAAPPDVQTIAARRGLERLRQGATRYTEHRRCFSCHHQALTLAAFAAAKARGLRGDQPFVAAQVSFTLESFREKLKRVRQGQAVPGGNTMTAYALFALRQAGHPADETTAALVDYLLVRQKADGAWPALMPRPPSEGSSFTNTALALMALSHYGKASDRRVTEATALGKAWLRKATPKTTEDRVFHLRGLRATGADPALAREALLKRQRADGSWSQLDDAQGDAYATATVLYALDLPPDDTAYRRGIAYLIRTQKADGSWFVATRSRPVQTFFDNGDPGGKSQFISFLATGWATWVLVGSER